MIRVAEDSHGCFEFAIELLLSCLKYSDACLELNLLILRTNISNSLLLLIALISTHVFSVLVLLPVKLCLIALLLLLD